MNSNIYAKTPRSVFRFILISIIFSFAFAGKVFAADMQPVVFIDDIDPVPAYGTFHYRIDLKNNVSTDAEDVELNVTIPATFTYIANSHPSDCNYTGNVPSQGDAGDKLICQWPNFPGSSQYDMNITLKAGMTTGVFESTATVDSKVEDNSANNSESAKTTVVESADMNITKTSLINPIVAGGIETYRFEVHNKGPFKLSVAEVTDTLPLGLEFYADNNSTPSDNDGDWDCTNSGQDITCTGPTMEVDDFSVFYFRVKVTASSTGTIANTVEVSSEKPDSDPDNNIDIDELTVIAGTDMSIDKIIDTDPAISDQNVTFRLIVKNEGPMTADNVRVVDTLPSGYTNVVSSAPAGWVCSDSDSGVECNRTDPMAANITEVITIVAQAPHVSPDVVTHTNTAVVETTTADAIPQNNTDTVQYPVSPDQADLRLTKSKSPNPVAVGEEAISTIMVHNIGPRPATPVQVVDVLSSIESYVSGTGTDWNCTHDGSTMGGSVVCDYDQTLTVGSDAPVLTIVTKAESNGTMENHACTGGSGGSTEPSPFGDDHTANDCSGASVEATDVNHSTDIGVTKIADKVTVAVNENTLTYTIEVENLGPNLAEAVDFRDDIPQYIAASTGGRAETDINVTTDNGTSANCTVNGKSVFCPLGDIAVDEIVTVSIVVTRAMLDGSKTNTASAYSTLTGDTNRANNEDSVDVLVEPVTDIELTSKQVTYLDPSQAILAGTEALYTIQVRNNGPSIAQNVEVSDVFSGESFTFLTASAGCTYDAGNRTLDCDLGDMAEDTVKSIFVKIRPDENATLTGNWEIDNTATVSMTTADSNPDNNDKNVTLEVRGGEVDLAIEKNESPDFHEPVLFDPANTVDNYIVYEVVIQNYGPSLATDITFTDKVDSVYPDNGQKLYFVGDTANSDGTDADLNDCTIAAADRNFTVEAGAPEIICHHDSLAAGTEYKRYLVFHIENAPHLVSGDVYHDDINVTSAETDIMLGNNEEDEKTTVRVITDPQITKTSSKNVVEVGEEFNFTIDVINNGPGWSPYTQVKDTLPSGMVLTGTPLTTQGRCLGDVGETSFECSVDDINGTLQDGVLVTITVPVKMISWPGDENSNDTNVTVTNTGFVSTIGPDSNLSNNENNAIITVQRPAHIGNRVWLDRNADGIQTYNPNNDRNIPNIPVYLILDSNNSIVQTTITDSSGEYGFDINSSDDYRVEFNLTGTLFQISPQDVGSDVDDSDINASGSTEIFTVNYGDNNLTIDAGLYRLVDIGNRVWVDKNGDGLQTAGEANVSDVNVTLWYDDNRTQVLTDFNGTSFGPGGAVTTDVSGLYSFTNLIPGRYYVVFDQATLPSSKYVFTTLKVGSTDSIDSDADRTTGETRDRLIRSDSDPYRVTNYIYRHFDAGIYIPASIGDYVWHDYNGDGMQESNETNLSGVEVTLMNAGCSSDITKDQNDSLLFVNPVSTDVNGSYLFNNLKPDTYCIKFKGANGYDITQQDASGSSDQNDSDVDNSISFSEGITGDYNLTSDEDNRSVDAGFYIPIRIGDRVWIDRNHNGIQDNGELNVSNVRVTLVTDGVLVTEFRDTNTSGEYLFDDLAPGHEYSVRFSNLDNDYKFTVQDQTVGADDTNDSDANATGWASGHTSILSSDDKNLTFDAGIYKPVTIGNYVWEDTNADGIQNDGATGIKDVNVTLVMDGSVTNITTLTDATGFYTFNDLLPDHNYNVEFTIPSGYFVTTQNATTDDKDSDADANGQNVASTPTMYSGDVNNTLDAGLYQNASMGNKVWIDANGNGLQDGTEVGINGITVELYEAGNSGLPVSQVTANGGLYHFEDLRPGSYYVVFSDLPANYVFTQQNKGGNNALDSDVNLTTGRSDIVTLVSNQDDNSTDAGIYIPVSVGDRIWHDVNADGNQSGESNIDVNVDVTLTDNNDATNTYITTAQNGDYLFTDVRPGNYHIEFNMPTGYDSVSPKDTTNDAEDSDVNPSTRVTDNFDLVSDTDQLTWDMGVYNTASIGDRIWLDKNADGIQDTDELNVTDTGITVELLDETNTSVTTQTGVTNGAYAFDSIVPGNYHVKFTFPATYVVSPQNVTGTTVDYMTDSDVNATTFLTEPTTLISGENDTSWDAGIYEPASFGDRIWLDANADGIQNNGEGNFTGSVMVTLLDENNNSVIDASQNTVTDVSTTSGAYAFTNLVPGSYHVKFTFPSGTNVSPLNQGNTDTDSDVRLDSNTTIDTVLESGENDTSWDAGVYALASLGDQVWIDTNGNGIQDDSEVLDINVTVVLYDGNTEVNRTTVIAGNDGKYLFEDLVPADYHVEFIPQVGSGYVFITANQGGDDTQDSDVDASGVTPVETISSGESNLTLDAGIYIPASIGDRVWLDANANGIQDPNENNISDLNVTLFNDQNVSLHTVQTDVNGTYIFAGLVPGDYHVEFALTDNSGQMYVVSPQGVMTGADDTNNSDANATGVAPVETLVSGEQNPNYDAGLYIPVAIGDFVWSDEDGDGVQDGNEPGIQDVNATLYRVENNGSVTNISSQDTNSTGGYLFTDLVPGNYYVHFAQPDHFRATLKNSGSDDAIDSDADLVTGNTAPFEIFSPEDNLTLDAGFYALATISGNVSEDTDNDDLGDVNLSGVTITLVDNNGSTIATTSTDSNGSYIFIDVEPGVYTVVETQPAGLVSVSENEGGADDDAGNTTLDNIISVIVGIGENDVNNDFVEEAGVTIGDRVWNDENGDGIQDSTETNTTGLDGIVVNLYNIQDTLIATTTTDINGEYLFENYSEDTYYVEFNLTTLPIHYGVTQLNQGSDDTNDSDANITTGITGFDYLSPGEDNRTFDMGIYLLGTISGMVLEDTNDDDIGDIPMAGVIIKLYDANGNLVATTTTDGNGYYEFRDLPQGVYTIKETQPFGYLDVGETDGDYPSDGSLNSIRVNLDAGEHDANNDFIEEIGGSIGNYVWYDKNGDGLQDPDETGVNAVYVCLEDDQGNAILDANDIQRCTDTNATGYYLFEGILPGNYVVVFKIPNGTALSPFPLEGNDDRIDSDPIDEIGGFAKAPVTVGLGDDILTIDMGLVYLNDASIGDFVWIDENRDGIFDDYEVGLDGVTVNLYNTAGKLLETILTHNGGRYLFEHLAAGTYIVEFVVPDALEYEFTQKHIGTGDLDSDADTLTGRTKEIVLREGEHIVVVDAGVYCGCEGAPVKANGGDSLGLLGMLGMMFLTLMAGLFFVRKEEEQRV